MIRMDIDDIIRKVILAHSSEMTSQDEFAEPLVKDLVEKLLPIINGLEDKLFEEEMRIPIRTEYDE